MTKYDFIYCDPQWNYRNKVSNDAANNHYSTVSIFNLTHLPIHFRVVLFFDTVTYTVKNTGSCQQLKTVKNKKTTSNLLMAFGFLIITGS